MQPREVAGRVREEPSESQTSTRVALVSKKESQSHIMTFVDVGSMRVMMSSFVCDPIGVHELNAESLALR